MIDIAAKVEAMSMPEPNSGCWLFLGTPSQRYGQISDGQKDAPRRCARDPRQADDHHRNRQSFWAKRFGREAHSQRPILERHCMTILAVTAPSFTRRKARTKGKTKR